MANKEATVYIVDCGMTMGDVSHGRSGTNLEWALEYVWDKITSTVATGRKTAMAGVVAFRTDTTKNSLEEDEDYRHICVLQDIGQILMPQLRHLSHELKTSKTEAGDAISALVIAIQMISTTCRQLKYDRKIVLVTDARGNMNVDQLDGITSKLKDDKIELVILGVDFDDAEFGFKEESKDVIKAENEEIWKTLCFDLGDLGTCGTLVEAVDELQNPRVKTVRGTAVYKGFLTLGNPEAFDTALAIDVERYVKVMIAKPPTASRFVVRHDMAAGEATQPSAPLFFGDDASKEESHDGLTGVKSARTYTVQDDNAPGGRKELDLDELSKGYEYGRTAVHISESDRNVTMYETLAGFDIVGFVARSQYERYLDMTRSAFTIAQRGNDKASMALSSIIHALFELDSYAVARMVPKDNKDPRILLLAPHIDLDFECLYDVELPFAEDVRSYKFPPLDRVVTVSGKTLKLHRNLPNDELQDAMSAYVDSMDLSTYGRDDNGEPAEYMPMEDTFSPKLHRINQVIKHRAIHPEKAPPLILESLTRFSHPPAELLEQANLALKRVIQAADVKKVPPKARAKRYGKKEAPKPLSDLDVDALLAQDPVRKQKRIDARNAIPEFKQLLNNADSHEQLEDACKQFKTIIFDWIRHSVGDSAYGRVIEGVHVMREEMEELESPELYNGALRELKEKLLAGQLGGERREIWFLIRSNRLGLIQRKECPGSDVDEEAAKAFLSAK